MTNVLVFWCSDISYISVNKVVSYFNIMIYRLVKIFLQYFTLYFPFVIHWLLFTIHLLIHLIAHIDVYKRQLYSTVCSDQNSVEAFLNLINPQEFQGSSRLFLISCFMLKCDPCKIDSFEAFVVPYH